MTEVNWREDYKQFTSDKEILKRLDEGAKSLAQSWHLQAMYNKWKKIRGVEWNVIHDLRTLSITIMLRNADISQNMILSDKSIERLYY